MRVPPLLVRRLVVAPLVVALEALVILVSPVVLLLAAVLSPVFGGARPLRVALIALAFVARHMTAILACFVLWVAAGFGRRIGTDAMQARHLALMRWFVRGIYDVIVGLAHVEVVTHESEDAREVLDDPERPVILLGRHAGEGDTLLVIYELLVRHGRVPHIVMHERLRLDPLIDMLGHRLPNRFVDPRGGDTEVEIAAMARDRHGRSALVLFPEGANFSAERRQRGIDRLEQAGHGEQAAWAREMRHVSAPRPGGALAAIDAAPDADVVVMGHVGFPNGLGEVWRLLPARQVVEVRLWHEPAGAIPDDRDAQIAWLFGWWRRLDRWVETCGRDRQKQRMPAPSR